MGASAGRMEHLTLHDFAADVAAVIEAEGGGPAVVLGHAFGQWVARTLAADRPDLVRGVVLAAAAAKSAPPELREHLRALRRHRPAGRRPAGRSPQRCSGRNETRRNASPFTPSIP